MANISDVIEDYILSTIEGETTLCISRNGLASFFNCSPSQINYVITTRFNADRGFIVESKRGGGGHLLIMRMCGDKNECLNNLVRTEIGQTISYNRTANILERLVRDDVLTEREMDIMLSMMNDKAMFFPEEIKDRLRANMLKSVVFELLKNRQY